MSVRRPGAGRRVGVGRVRVDAARAIAKLRDYQLPDRTAWVLEAIRAAVASDAVRIDLRGDANDVWLAWEGEPWPADILPRLLDELVSPEPARRGQRLRLLATAINSALGLDPAYIDVYSIPADGEPTRTRYTPNVLTVPDTEGETPPLELLDSQLASPPAGAMAPGMMVHLRRRAGLETLGFFVRGEPPEIALALRACNDVPVPLRVEGAEIGRHIAGDDLLRVPLGRDLDGFVALVDPRTCQPAVYSPLMDAAERGVIITSFPIALGPPGPRSRVPLRVYVDAPRMPTNASRSDVKHDAHPIADALRAAPAAFTTLCETLAQRLADPERKDYEALRVAALGLIGSWVSGAGWPLRAIGLEPPVVGIAMCTLLHSAVGEKRRVLEHWDTECVHTGRKPFDRELAPWLGTTLWIAPDDAGARLLAGNLRVTREAKRRARHGRRYLKARRRFLRHAQRTPQLSRPRRYWIRCKTNAPIDNSCAGAEGAHDGELCILRGGRGGELVLLHEGREIEDVELSSPIRFRAIVSPPGLRPIDGYRGVDRDAAYERAETQVQRALIRATEALAMALEGESLPAGFELGRGGIEDHRAAMQIVARGIRLASDRLLPIADDSPLARARVWQLAAGDVASLAQLRAHDAIGTTPRAAVRDRLSIERPLLLAGASERDLLRRLLEPDTTVVLYDSSRLPRRADVAGTLADRLVGSLGGAALAIQGDRIRGAIAWGGEASSLLVHHAGASLVDRPYRPQLEPPCVVAADCDDIVPLANWTKGRGIDALEQRGFGDWETAMARAIARALLGERNRDLRVRGASLYVDWGAGRALFAALATADDGEELLGSELWERLRNAPLFAVFGAKTRSAAQLAADFPGAIPYLAQAPVGAKVVPGWHPLIADFELAHGVKALAGSPVTEASEELGRRQQRAARNENLATHRRSAQTQLSLPNRGPHVAIEDDGIEGLVGPGTRPGLELVVFVEKRVYVRVERTCHLPLSAAFDIPEQLADDQFRGLPESTLKRLENLAVASVTGLLTSISETDPPVLIENTRVRRLLLAYVRSRMADAEFSATRALFNDVEALPTVQGNRIAIKAAQLDGSLRVAGWAGEWLPPESGDDTPLDHPVIRIFEGDAAMELGQLLMALSERPVRDVTNAVRRLQTARRMSRGLLPEPTVTGALPELKTKLRDLDPEMPPGEVALVPEPQHDGFARVHVFRNGVEIGDVQVAESLPLVVAIEAPELANALSSGASVTPHLLEPVRAQVDSAAWLLVLRVIERDGVDRLPEWLRSALVRSLMAGAVPESALGDGVAQLELFSTTGGTRESWQTLEQQAEQFGDVWYTTAESTERPLDDERLAVCLGPDETPGALASALPLVFAAEELALDQTARHNRDRPPVESLALGPGELASALFQVDLGGDGERAERGLVAPLRPGSGALRGLHVYRNMKPLGFVDDPCTWPTVAVVDDARLCPDRTWSAPADDRAYTVLVKAVRNASEVALARAFAAPTDALTSHSVGRYVETVDPTLAKDGVVVRGRVWLIGEPGPNGIRVQLGHHDSTLTPMRDFGGRSMPLPVSGSVMLHPPQSTLPARPLLRTIEILYPKLLGQLARRKKADPDLVAAHLAYGLALGVIEPEDAESVEFSCLSKGPATAAELAEFLRSHAAVEPDFIVDEDSALARTVRDLLRNRIRDPIPVPVFDTVEDDGDGKGIRLDELEDVIDPPSDRQEHPLDGLADALHRRLLEAGAGSALSGAVQIKAGASRPIADYSHGLLILAGDNELLHELSRAAETAPEALDLLAAHALTVMNCADSAFTDASERHGLIWLLQSG